MRKLALLTLSLLIAVPTALLGTAAARADAVIDAIAQQLRSDWVYNDPAAENALTPAEVTSLRDQISNTGVPIYIAVLPAADATAAGSPDDLLVEVRNAVGRDGVYAIVAGNAFRAGSTSGSVRQIADDAFASQKANGVYAVLSEFVRGVDSANSSGSTGNQGSAAGSSSGGSGVGLLIGLGVIALIVVGGVFFLRSRAKKSTAARMATVRAVLDEDVTDLGERLGAFDLSDPRLDDAGRADLQKALDSYSAASDSAARASSDADVVRATSELEEGRFSLACVEARMDGRPAPVHRPPCFVDPRHGPSLSDVTWAPDGGTPHPVPLCAACEATISAGGMPQAREVSAGGVQVPYWRAGRDYAPYARGYYSSFGDILPALFVGTMLASAFSTPAAHAAPLTQTDSTTRFGGGDFGGGFGGGDFGGGGGDFGGGDF